MRASIEPNMPSVNKILMSASLEVDYDPWS